MNPETRQQLLDLLDQMPERFADLPGEVFSTGTRALVVGDFYIAGLNPGPGCSYPNIHDHVANWSLENYSAFLHQCWRPQCWITDCYGFQTTLDCSHPRGSARHQKAVKRMMRRARPEIDLQTVFATNAIFAKSRSADTFYEETGRSLSRAFEACWPLHMYFLSVVRPRVILSLGYAEGASAFSLFRDKAVSVEPVEHYCVNGRKHPSFKWAEMRFTVSGGDISPLVVGIRHPSYVPYAADVQEFTNLITRRLTTG